MHGTEAGQVIQAHVPVDIPCTGDLTDYIAAFLIGAAILGVAIGTLTVMI